MSIDETLTAPASHPDPAIKPCPCDPPCEMCIAQRQVRTARDVAVCLEQELWSANNVVRAAQEYVRAAPERGWSPQYDHLVLALLRHEAALEEEA